MIFIERWFFNKKKVLSALAKSTFNVFDLSHANRSNGASASPGASKEYSNSDWSLAI